MRHSFIILGYFLTSLILVVSFGCAKFEYSSIVGFGSFHSSCQNPITPSDFQTGTGTVVDPFVICSPAQFLNLANNSVYYANHFVQ